jgi:hypothetical protein
MVAAACRDVDAVRDAPVGDSGRGVSPLVAIMRRETELNL